MNLLEKFLESWKEDQQPGRPGDGLTFRKWLDYCVDEGGVTPKQAERLKKIYKGWKSNK